MTEPHIAVATKTVGCNNTIVTIRALTEADRAHMLEFGASLPADDVLYLEDDFRSPEIIARLINASYAENWRQVVATANDAIVGYAAVRRLPGRSSHVGDIHMLVSPDWRGCGLGRAMADVIFDAARDLGVDKVIVEILDTQATGRQIFERIGFAIEGTLVDHASDRQGQRHSLHVLAYHIR